MSVVASSSRCCLECCPPSYFLKEYRQLLLAGLSFIGMDRRLVKEVGKGYCEEAQRLKG